MIKSHATVPIILGLSVLSVGAACIYTFLKKKDDRSEDASDGNGLSKIAKLVRMISKEDFSVIELTLSKNIVPLIIGRKNCSISHIQNCTKTEISFHEKDELFQICRIRGTESGVREAEHLILKEASRQIILTEEIVVPQSACGRILGRCGDALQEICRKSMAKVWIEGSRTPGESRRVMITGTQSQITTAKSLIEQKVKDDTDFRKSQEHLDIRREPRIRTPPSSLTATPVPREVVPPTVEKLKTTNSSGQLEVFVSAIVSPSRFFLQLVGPQSAELDILVESMTEYYNQPENRELHMIRKPYLGQIVAAEFNADSKWYRAEIVAILPNEYKPSEVVLDLYFVDYGDNQYIQPREVYELRPDFLALRFQAIECFLAHVEANNSVTSPTGEEEWEPSAISRFEELTHVAQWRKLLSRVATYQNKGHRGNREGREGSPIPGVELYDTRIDGTDINIALELINEGHAKPTRKFGDLSSSHVLRLDGGSRTTSSERLNDVSSASTSSSFSSIISTINTSRKALQESANEEANSIAILGAHGPEISTLDVNVNLNNNVNSIVHTEKICGRTSKNIRGINQINQTAANESETNHTSSTNGINSTNNGVYTCDEL
ncbi:tudor and KH domain-containing protein homolog [Wyeomyia smithii]|uniref:tudor and KH domain-containing protein homolog n=1 Tax=Wyeomyia smithii TaxID=174621 RepID=UPI002467FFE4|nr:tudor and KH domain-containing protein homolog [Wyeomyia smithii]XP_055545489.1 tudor and KH domain-containing protein homolog [Wyeomyia smithii]XP_055545490.1 tudor and KH domain-containing protein homolog [Wyeomyia smithii]XP_055545491.1 tudor and KH domain-containing protein homolog [Wyeomyia smithii]